MTALLVLSLLHECSLHYCSRADIDECLLEPVPCHMSAHCRDTAGGFMCACNDGYMGDGFHCESETIIINFK